jgi:hypothetical protein
MEEMNFDAKRINELREKWLKSQYLRKDWVTDPKDDLTLKQYSEWIEPALKHMSGAPRIIEKTIDKDGRKISFLKMEIQLEGKGSIEFDLSYKKTIKDEDLEFEDLFEEGDLVDPSTLMFRNEKYLDKEHLYATGKILEE